VSHSVLVTPPFYDVVVVGAGPTGFTLAIDLGRRGIRTLLIEKDPSTKQWPKMDRSNARTMEFYRRLGFADRVRELGYPADASMDVFIVTRLSDPPLARLQYPTVAEHRAKIAATTDASEPLEPYQLVSQNDLEPLLKEIAEATPNVTVRFGCELVGFDQDDEGVDVHVRDLETGVETLRGSYLAGCDGGRSFVRRSLGIKLEGRGGLADMRQVTFRSEGLYDSIPIGQGRHYYVADELNSGFVIQGSRKDFTLGGSIPEDVDLEQVIRDRLGFDTDIEVRNSISWKFHLLLAERYREGRIFLAGDAVHLVIPTGGLGMNTGVGDAIDLSWKLAGTVAGWAGAGVLDSYEPERRAIGRRNVDAAGWAAEGMMKWRAHWGPEITEDGPTGEAKRLEVGREANLHHRRVHEMVGVELGYSYAGSNLIGYEPDNVAEWDTRIYAPHTRPGMRIPHLWLRDGRAMQDALGPDYNIVDFTGIADTTALEDGFARIGAPLQVLRIEDPHAAEVYECSLLLLRPDLHVYWRGDQRPEDVLGLARAATGHQGSFHPTASSQVERPAVAR
jgi:2-polyprenyl-6-methoxyphenol hydroxylase-like FAD-dependent oxidoreductase